MRTFYLLAVGLVLAGMAATAYAELQNVEVTGELRTRGRWYHNVAGPNWPGETPMMLNADPGKRPVGVLPGRTALSTVLGWDDSAQDLKLVDQRVRLGVKADFTDKVNAVIELDANDVWGTDFRSNYITGADIRGNTANDVEVFQGYVEANEMFDMPLRLRIGRQAMRFGNGFLVDDHWSPIVGTSYDAIRATYTGTDYTIDAWWSKLAENSPLEEDGDIDFYGIYGTYTGIEHFNVSLYYLLVRDANQIIDTAGSFWNEMVEDWFGLDDYDVTNLNTIGTHVWGNWGAWDYTLEMAYQFGNASQVGSLFQVPSIYGTYGDDDADWGAFGAEGNIGYSFDINWQPRVYAAFRYFGGEDNRDIDFLDWLNPFYTGEASVTFNRLFTGCNCCPVMFDNNLCSNFWSVMTGVSAAPMANVVTGFDVEYYSAVATFDAPRSFNLGGWRVSSPVSTALPFWTEDTDDELGIATRIWVNYNYSQDLFVRVAWEHLFTGDGLTDGNYTVANGLDQSAGTDDDDADLLYFLTVLKF